MNQQGALTRSGEKSPVLTFIKAGDSSPGTVYSRADLEAMGRRGARLLRGAGLQRGDRFLTCMDANRVDDLAWRIAAQFTGTIPVTVNWQADSCERIQYKMTRTGAKVIVMTSGFATRERREMLASLDGCRCLSLHGNDETMHADLPGVSVAKEDTQIIIFTSGTTGEPKPVALSYDAYATNQLVFESFLGIEADESLTLVVINPLHHANSTAITDWALRRSRTHLVLFERFNRGFWQALVNLVEGCEGRVVVPAVSRHFDVLESMAKDGELGVDEERLKRALSRVTFLLGSAPVGPSTVATFQKWTGQLPIVRFGSTELCLQALGTSPRLPEAKRLLAFRRGWKHEDSGQALTGFYIGRPHSPWTEARIVSSVDPLAPDFMKSVPDGQLGRIVVRSGSVFTGYWGDGASTGAAMHDGWYLGLGDHGFCLRHPEDETADFYWVGRDAGLMIRGGSNYSCQQVRSELSKLLQDEFGLKDGDFDLAVIGLKLESEHEDTCCVMLEIGHGSKHLIDIIALEFLPLARKKASKGARPDRLQIGVLPRNFKGALDVRAMKAIFEL